MKTSPHELQALLDLNGTEMELMDGQFFAKFEVHTPGKLLEDFWAEVEKITGIEE